VVGCCECGDEPSVSCATELVSYTEIISHLKTLCSHIQPHMTSHNQTAAYHLNMRKTYLLPLEENVDFCI
jgi:hypothetical protein